MKTSFNNVELPHLGYIVLLENANNSLNFLENKSALQMPSVDNDIWFDINQLCGYLPEKPSKGCVYAWVAARKIPFHKRGKKLLFLKSEIDSWQRQILHDFANSL